jgi:transcriptional regulator with XRE-family HTH domain
MPLSKAKAPHIIDVLVGQRLKQRRCFKNMSAQALGKEIGVTFQQIQKYESGLNRISASKLYQIAQSLDVSISYFFQDAPPPNIEKQKL